MGHRSRLRVILAALITLTASTGAATLAPVDGAARQTTRAPAVANPAALAGLDAAARTMLARNGFVVTAPAPLRSFDTSGTDQSPALYLPNRDPHHLAYWQFYDLYEQNVADGIPAFVTSDALLHTFHVIYDQTLIVLERNALSGKLRSLSHGLAAAAAAQYAAAADPRVKAAARLNLAYVAVAERLLDPSAATPAVVAADVERELRLITAHQGFALSPIVGYAVDYSKFVPRGHYAGDPTLSSYFQAMTWYGLLTFHLNGSDGPLRTRQALLLVRALAQRPDLTALWAAIFDPITTWVGRSDDLTVRDYTPIMARVYGAQAPLSALADDARLARFIALANALPDPRIRDEVVLSSKGAANQTKGLRLFGQRFTADSAIMQALIWDHVGTPQQPRLWPLGLDVAAALGSQQAASLAAGLYHQTRYAHYAQQLAAVQTKYSALPATDWSQNLYWSWLNTLRAVWGEAPPAAPAFMKTPAWAAKSVATGLASWAELRHDTLLYVKQVSGLGGGGASPPPVAYVEPVPLVYARLLALTQGLKATLLREGMLDSLPTPIDQWSALQTPPFAPEQGYRGALDTFAGVLALAQRVSEQELLGQRSAAADLLALDTIAGPLGALTNFFQDNAARKYLQFYYKQVASIADVFTEPMSSQVLEVGVGDVLPLYAVVTINGRHWLTRGGVYSYYEFHQPMSDRLTDDAWRRASRRPGLPAWTAGYAVY